MCMIEGSTCHGICMEIRTALWNLFFKRFPSSHGFWGWNSDQQVCTASAFTNPSYQARPGIQSSAKASQEEPHRAGLVTWAVSGTISLRQLHPSPQCQRDSQSGSCSVSKGLRVGNTSRKLPRGEAVMGTNRRR